MEKKYKLLTDEMKHILEEEIKKVGGDELKDRIEYNARIEYLAKLQNEPDAFENVYQGLWHCYKWEREWMNRPFVMGDLQQEMIDYIDRYEVQNKQRNRIKSHSRKLWLSRLLFP